MLFESYPALRKAEQGCRCFGSFPTILSLLKIHTPTLESPVIVALVLWRIEARAVPFRALNAKTDPVFTVSAVSGFWLHSPPAFLPNQGHNKHQGNNSKLTAIDSPAMKRALKARASKSSGIIAHQYPSDTSISTIAIPIMFHAVCVFNLSVMAFIPHPPFSPARKRAF